jgi:hypothetical protein
MTNAATQYPQALTECDHGQHPSVISEDDKITLRLSPLCLRDCDLTAMDLDSLSASDQILIMTARNTYIFTVTDPTGPSGSLKGGILGNQLVEAYLLPTRVEAGASRLARKSLSAGARLTFIIGSDKGLQKMTTSPVKSLLHRKRAAVAAPLINRPRVTLDLFSE